MGTNINLTVPDHVYQQAEQLARDERRSLTDVLNEALSQAFPTAHINPDRATMEEELKAFGAMSNELLGKYMRQYVAVSHGRVVDNDVDRVALVARIDKRYPEQVVLIRFVTPDEDLIIDMPSPRLIK
jgi:hypothetical protein